MVQTILIGLVAGVAAALLYLAPAGGSLLAFPLFALTGVPIAIAGLGWSALAAAVAAVVGAATIAMLLPAGLSALVFILLFGVPMVWLTRLAGLSRQTGRDGPREWYPLGRILFHAGLACALVLVVAGIVTGYDSSTVVEGATAALVEWLAEAQTEPLPTADEIAPVMRAYVAVMPLMLAILLMAITVFDLSLGALIARISGRLKREGDKLSAVALPNAIPIGALIAVPLAFLPTPVGEVAQVFAGAFIAALAVVGLAVLHSVTVGMSGRTAILIAAYVLLLLSGVPVVLFALLGVGESFLHLRARRAGPPSRPD